MMHKSTAFLVMSLDVTTVPPSIHEVGLYSEERPTTKLSQYRQFTVAVGCGLDYGEGVDHLKRQIAGSPWLHWCIPCMLADTRAALGVYVARGNRS